MLIIADTSPLNYLILLELDHLLPELYGDILVPPQVMVELAAQQSPTIVREWAQAPPRWLRVEGPTGEMPDLQLDSGETAAIVLAEQRHADLLLIDERDGRAVATARFGLNVAGTLGVIRDAAVAGRVELVTAFDRLRQTSFRAAPALYEQILREVSDEQAPG